jgi:hypothetical protein
MQPIVVPSPDRPDGVGLFKDRGVEALGLKRHCRGEAGGACGNDDDDA